MVANNEIPPPPTFGSNIEENSPLMVIMNIINTLTQYLLGAVAFSAIFFVNIFVVPRSFGQHVYLCVTGYTILMSQAVLTLSPHSSWSKSFSYEDKKIIHWVMQVTGSILAIAGSIIRIVDVENNFRTAHGILGLIAMICTFLSLISGIINLLSMSMRNNINLIKIVHSALGALALCIAFLSLCLGFHNSYRAILGDKNANLSISLTVLALMGTLTSSCFNIFRRILS